MPARSIPALLIIFAAFSIQAATISVQVRDSRGAGMADAVIYATPEGRTPPAARATAVMDQKDRMFIPHVLAIQAGTAVEFPNSDDIQHHVYSFSRPKPFQLPLYKGTPGKPVVFDKPGVVILGCNIHDRMSAFIVVVDTPYFAKTEGSGKAEIEGLAAGAYSVRLWYPDMRKEPPPIRVEVGTTDRHVLTFSADR